MLGAANANRINTLPTLREARAKPLVVAEPEIQITVFLTQKQDRICHHIWFLVLLGCLVRNSRIKTDLLNRLRMRKIGQLPHRVWHLRCLSRARNRQCSPSHQGAAAIPDHRFYIWLISLRHAYTHTHPRICICTYIHIHMHIYIIVYTCIHTHIYIDTNQWYRFHSTYCYSSLYIWMYYAYYSYYCYYQYYYASFFRSYYS